MSIVKQLVILVTILLCGGGLWYANDAAELASLDNGSNSGSMRPSGENVAPVIVHRVTLEPEESVVQSPGSGIAVKSVTLFPETSGRVTEILFTAGKTVEEGGPLLRLDDRAEQLDVQLARVHVKEARRKLDRMRKLAPRGTVALTQLELAETELDAARIELAQRQHVLTQRTILAPFSGVTGIPQVDPGERVSETTPVTTLDDRSIVLVDFEVPEAYAGGVRTGATIDISAWATGQQRFEGVVDSIGSQVDPATRTLTVRAAVANEQDLLRPGMSFVVRMPLRGDLYPLIPSVSVLWDQQGSYVWRVANDKAERIPVRILKRTQGSVLVDGSLARDDLVVVEGVQRMRSGRKVRIIDSDEDQKAGGNG